jgi:hypothetical protein
MGGTTKAQAVGGRAQRLVSPIVSVFQAVSVLEVDATHYEACAARRRSVKK